MSGFPALFCFLALSLTTVSTAEWNSSVVEKSGTYQLVLKAELQDGYYTHPAGVPYVGVSLVLDEAKGVRASGDPIQKYKAVEYKGEEVVTGSYMILQGLDFDGPGEYEISGCVTWSSCSGDACGMPEEYHFSHKVTIGRTKASRSSWSLVLEAVLWGLLMLLTPCVFPMVPMTVSYFLKNSSNRSEGKVRAALYGLFIVLIYTLPVLVLMGVTSLLGGETVNADIFNWLSTHWIPNLIFFVVFVAFALSFFGLYEITLPSKWVNGADRNSDRQGIAGVFFLALTLVLVSFSCTGPIVGTVLLESTRGEFWMPFFTMLAFSLAFALPFTLLAFFPSVLSKLPKSGDWLEKLKVSLGFVELALSLKFLSVIDQTYHWNLLSRELYLIIWVILFTLMGLYLLGVIRTGSAKSSGKTGTAAVVSAVLVFVFVGFLIAGICGAPLKALSGYLPPQENTVSTGSGRVQLPYGLSGYDNLDDAISEAEANNKSVFVDITGYGCVNCREMDERVLSDERVKSILADRFVIAALFVDDKTPLPREKWIETDSGHVLKDVGRVNARLVMSRFGVNSQPSYVLLNGNGDILAGPRPYDLDVDSFVAFLNSVL